MTTTTGDGAVVTPEDLARVAPSKHPARFPVRVVDLGIFAPGAGRCALITIDDGQEAPRPTTLGPAAFLDLRESMDSVEAMVAAGEVACVAITGKPFVFVAGADLKGVGSLTSREQALAMARLGHAQLRRLGELSGPHGPVPSFALVNGVALGGGLEVALHCTYRTVSSAAGRLGLPEAGLGLVPGWGGTQLLPRLVGIENALRVVVANPLAGGRTLSGPAAVETGVGDVLLEAADFIEESLRWAARVVVGEVSVERTDHVAATPAQAWDGAVEAARARVTARFHGAAPAYERALDLLALARTAERDAGFAAEDQALGDLLVSEQFRSGVYAFDLTTSRAKRPAGAPDPSLARPVTKVGVVGAGLMASQLALLLARRLRVPVVMTDVDADRVGAGVARVHAGVADLAAKGRLGADAAARITALVTGTTDIADPETGFAGADWVIEAVFEDLAVKKEVFARVEAVVPQTCVLATNTSSLPVAAMAADLAHPERVVGFHFFNPVAVLPLVEVVRTDAAGGGADGPSAGTDDATLATAFAVGKVLGKTCVLVRDRPAFVVNRLLMRLMGEVHAAFDEGTPAQVADAALDPLGLPMSPFDLLALVGPAVALHVQETLHEAFPDRFAASPNIAAIVRAGLPGFWEPEDKGSRGGARTMDPRVVELLRVGDSPSTAEQVRERALAALSQEARTMLDEGVVADPREIDLCLLLGVGWPAHLGGLLPYLDRSGAAEAATGRRFLDRGVASLSA